MALPPLSHPDIKPLEEIINLIDKNTPEKESTIRGIYSRLPKETKLFLDKIIAEKYHLLEGSSVFFGARRWVLPEHQKAVIIEAISALALVSFEKAETPLPTTPLTPRSVSILPSRLNTRSITPTQGAASRSLRVVSPASGLISPRARTHFLTT